MVRNVLKEFKKSLLRTHSIISQLTMIFLPLLALLFSQNVRAQVTFVPPAIPLAVRSPYLNCWLPNVNSTIFGQTWPATFVFKHSQV